MAFVDLPLPKFHQRFSTEEACLQAIFEIRWPKGFICPYCGHNDGNRISSRPRIVQCCVCRRQTSITANTIFHRSHIPLTQWFLGIYLFAHDKGGASATRIAKQLGMHYATVWFMLHRLRFAMATREENLTLAGYIEMDEAFFGGRSKNKRMRKSPFHGKKQVLVMVESEGHQAGNLVMRVIDGNRWDDLKPAIAQKVESDPPGQWFRTDGWGSHHVVMSLGHQLKMGAIPNERQHVEMPCVNLAVSHAKRFFKGTYHHFCKTHIQRYLDEFCYRWNRRHLFGHLASRLIAACVWHDPISYTMVTAAA